MQNDATIRIAAVENGFMVDLAPAPTFIGSRRANEDEYLADSVRVFETIESLTAWLQEHFTYRPDSKADRWTEEEIAEIRKQGPGAITINKIPIADPEAGPAPGRAGTLAAVSFYDAGTGEPKNMTDIYGSVFTSVTWGTDARGNACLLFDLR